MAEHPLPWDVEGHLEGFFFGDDQYSDCIIVSVENIASHKYMIQNIFKTISEMVRNSVLT